MVLVQSENRHRTKQEHEVRNRVLEVRGAYFRTALGGPGCLLSWFLGRRSSSLCRWIRRWSRRRLDLCILTRKRQIVRAAKHARKRLHEDSSVLGVQQADALADQAGPRLVSLQIAPQGLEQDDGRAHHTPPFEGLLLRAATLRATRRENSARLQSK